MQPEGKSPSPGTPAAEIEIDAQRVCRLLEEQHPDLSHLPLRLLESGWDNAMFRLGDRLLVRLPRRKVAATLIENEQKWLPVLADRLPLPIPTPLRVGQPAQGYPWRWSVLPWIPGRAADQEEPIRQSERWGSFLRSLHVPAPSNAPPNPVRGVPLSIRAATVEERLQRLETKTALITRQIRHLWDLALHASWDVSPTWLHGDLHARNILVENGVLTGIIDWGDITAGDIATDLASLWMLFSDRQARQEALAAYAPVSPPTLQRAKGWAVLFGVMLLDSGLVDNPRNAALGEKTLRRIAEDG